MSIDVVAAWLYSLLNELFSWLTAVVICLGLMIGLYSAINEAMERKPKKGGDV